MMLLSNLWTWLFTAFSLSPSSSYTNTNTSTLSTNTTATRPLMIAVEGNIASGKSTFLELLSKQHNVAIFPEPVARWTDVGGTNLFRDMCVVYIAVKIIWIRTSKQTLLHILIIIKINMMIIIKIMIMVKTRMENGARWMHAFQLYSSFTRVEIAYQVATKLLDDIDYDNPDNNDDYNHDNNDYNPDTNNDKLDNNDDDG